MSSVLSVEAKIAVLISEKVLYGDEVALGKVVLLRRARGIFGSPIVVSSCSDETRKKMRN